MTYYFISDLHVDFYAPLSRRASTLEKYFEEFFERNFLPADACCIAGDIANNYFTYVEFLRFIACKYSDVYVCFGNHDIITEHADVYGSDRDFLTSECKMEYFLEQVAEIPNVHLLENGVVNGVAGCMGMCDFKYKHEVWANEQENKLRWRLRWFDGRHWNYKQNNPAALWAYYDGVMDSLTRKNLKVMMTHFLPLEFGMSKDYERDANSNFFYFQGTRYLENLPDNSIWLAGHTHTAFKKKFCDSLGKSHLLLCNPIGYPNESPLFECSLKREDFLIQI